ncbi:MAG TPA: hypothetical protein VFG42_02300 [Baekduia sp.]|uniref:hypothetical protein n=1 Tax=Baekduia sp. TaxID=2600305 RepID=UPI002D7918A1|nr:hypothetical protein [Baekduia sp.]HET6505598.1 hypothetical protein [Baekduia sp.]
MSDLARRRGLRDERDRTALDGAVEEMLDVLYAATEQLDVRVLVVAMFGDPFAGDDQDPEGGHSVPIRASFASLRASGPVTDPQKRYLALEGMRAASDSLFTEMSLGLDLADAMNALADRRDAGDQAAAAALKTVFEAARAARAAREGAPVPDVEEKDRHQ